MDAAHSGGGDAAEWLVPKSMWLAAHEPETYAGADWLKATVDAMGLPMQILPEVNLTILGAAACAATGAGFAPDLFEAAKAVAQPTMVLDPDPRAHDRYLELLSEYREATELLTPLMHRLAKRQLRSEPHV